MHWTTQLIAALLWYSTIAIFGAIAFPWLALLFRRLPDRGYGAARIGGLLTVAYASWWIAAAGGRFRADVIYAILVTGALASAALVAGNEKLRDDLRRVLHSRVWRIELAIFAVFIFAACLRAFQPEIFWGEKPMDFTFYNYFSRLELLPPEDPWASDRPIRYYYMGNWLFAVLQKLTHVAPGVGYNLALISIPTLAFGALVSALLPIVRRLRWAFGGALIPIFLANTEAARFLVTGEDRRLNFDFFWATSRILKHSIANEYPIWSYLFGDLHAHVIALPCAAFLLAIFVGLLAQKKRPPVWRGVAMRLGVGAAWGALFPINGWDAIAYGVVIPMALALRAPARVFRDAPRTALGRRLLDGGLIGIAAFAVAYPFWESILPIQGSTASGWTPNEFHGLSALWRVGGGLWLPLIGVAIALTLRVPRGTRRTPTFGWANFATSDIHRLPRTWDDWMRWLPVGVLLALALHPKFQVTPWANLFTGAVLLATAWTFRFGHGHGGNRRLVGALMGGAGMLFLFIESYWLVERLNSLFKLHYALWFLCAFLVAASLPVIVSTVGMAFQDVRNRQYPFSRRAVLALAALLILIPGFAGVVGTGTAVLAMTTFQRVNGPRPSLDGTAYLRNMAPFDADIVDWLRKNAPTGSVIVEAQGDSYREYTRIAMHTGLPTVLGWEHHVKQRSTPPQEVDNRRRDIEVIYTTGDDAERLTLLDRYGVRYVIVTSVERQRYGQNRFQAWERLAKAKEGRLRLAFETSGGAIYSVEPPEKSDRALTARE